jgi:hypothetical protein
MSSRNAINEKKQQLKDERLKEMNQGIADGTLVVRRLSAEEIKERLARK